MQISVVSGTDRETQREQIERMLQRAQTNKEPVRIRLPFTMYGKGERGYLFVRDATWNLQLPSEQTTPEAIEELIAAIGTCIVAIATEGSAQVCAKLTSGAPQA